MTNSELPGERSQQTPSHQPEQTAPVQAPQQAQQPAPDQQQQHGYAGQGTSTMPFPPQQAPVKKGSNVVGLIALIAAGLGFIFACIPGALIVGWILLPIAFILGLVSLFLKGKSKWMGITALALSIVGTIVGVTVFIAVLATSVEEAVGPGETTVVESSDSAAGDGADAEAAAGEDSGAADGTRQNPYPIGSVIESDEWRVVVNSVTLAATDAVIAANEFNEPPAEGSEYILVNYSATYIGDDANGQMPAFVSLEYVTADGTTVNGLDSIAVAPEPIDTTSTLYTDGTATGNTVFAGPTATAGEGVLAVRPGMLGDKVFVAVK